MVGPELLGWVDWCNGLGPFSRLLDEGLKGLETGQWAAVRSFSRAQGVFGALGRIRSSSSFAPEKRPASLTAEEAQIGNHQLRVVGRAIRRYQWLCGGKKEASA